MDALQLFSSILNPLLIPVQYAGNYLGNLIGSSIPDNVVQSLNNATNSLGGWLGGAIANILTGVINLLPLGGTLPTNIHTAAISLGNDLASVNPFVPVDVLIYCLALVITVKMALWALHFVTATVYFVRGVPIQRYETWRL